MAQGRLWTNARIATMRDDGGFAGRPYGLIENGAVAERDGRIVWVGPAADAPTGARDFERIDLAGMLVTPGLIDCHTHLVHCGDRAAEFELRLQGASYAEIAKAGGGILSTVAATRQASQAELANAALPRLDALLSEGVTTIEIKSGYGLDTQTEGRMLRAAKALSRERLVSVSTTFLGAHAIPREFENDADGYIDLVCEEMIPALAGEGAIDAVDGFCESIAFSPEQIDRVFVAAKACGLPVKLHAEQLSNLGGAALAASHGALSADHLEYLCDAGIAAMAESGTVAVLLPGAFYTLRETELPPVQALRDAGVPIAVATDANPGSSPVTSILTTLNMACILFRLTPEEALAGVTRTGARALGLTDRGAIKAGLRCDLAVWREERPGALAYRVGFNPLDRRIVGGETCPG